MHKGLFGFLALLLAAFVLAGNQDSTIKTAAKPKVRAITAFVSIDGAKYAAQLENTAKLLKEARAAYEAAGFTVETVRITTQPFPEYTRNMNHADALAMLRNIDVLARKFDFRCSIGPAMIKDNDDIAAVDLLADLLSTGSGLNASIITAGDDGIHWNALQQSARLIKAVSERSLHGQGNFNFAAISMLKPYGPFFPGSYHLGEGHQFSVGLEGANVVEAVFAKDQNPRTAEQSLAAALSLPLGEAEKIAERVASQSKWTPHLLSTCKSQRGRLMRRAGGFAPATPGFIALRPTLSSREGAQSAPRLSATPVALRSHPCVALSSPES